MAILDEVAGETVDVVVTPECFLDGYVVTEASVSLEQLREYAIDPSESPYVSSVSKWAGAASAWLIFGCSRITPAGVYNTALIFDRKGGLKGSYDKIHCQTHDKKYLPGHSARFRFRLWTLCRHDLCGSAVARDGSIIGPTRGEGHFQPDVWWA